MIVRSFESAESANEKCSDLLKIYSKTHRTKSVEDQDLSNVALIEKPELELKIKEFEL